MTSLKSETLGILVRVLGKAVTHGPAKKRITDPKTVAVVYGTTNLGDMVCATPIFRAIKKAYPTARLIVVGSKKNGELLAGSPDIDRYVPAAAFDEAVAALTEEKVDAGVSVNAGPREVGMLYLAGAKCITSFSYPGAGTAFAIMSTLIITVPYTVGAYVPLENLKLLKPLGVTASDTTKTLTATPVAVEKVTRDAAALGTGPLVIMSPGAGQAFREWAPERFAAVARYAQGRGARIALIGLKTEEAGVKFMEGMQGTEVLDARGQSIEEMKALISIAQGVVANDSGAIYIAEAFGVPTITIAGVADPKEHAIETEKHRVLVPEKMDLVVHALTSNVDAVDVAAARRQLDSIPVSAATAALDQLL